MAHTLASPCFSHEPKARVATNLNDDKLFKIAKLNLLNKAKEWFKKLNPPLAD